MLMHRCLVSSIGLLLVTSRTHLSLYPVQCLRQSHGVSQMSFAHSLQLFICFHCLGFCDGRRLLQQNQLCKRLACSRQ